MKGGVTTQMSPGLILRCVTGATRDYQHHLKLFSKKNDTFNYKPRPLFNLLAAPHSMFTFTVSVAQSCPTLCDRMDWTTRLLCPWDFPGKNTGVSSCSLLKGNLANQDQNQISMLQADYLRFEPPGKPCHSACGILFPQPGIKPISPALEA